MNKKIIITIALLIMAVGTLLLYILLREKIDPFLKSTSVPSQSDNTVPSSTKQFKQQQQQIKNFNAAMRKIIQIDADADGISDSDEKNTYHTNPQQSDTDSDGLLDKDEIGLYHTDPNKADTDGDGFKDGYELQRRYNPNGAGRL